MWPLQSQLDVKRKEQQDCEKDMNAINKYVAGLQDKSVRLDRQIEEFKRRVGELGTFPIASVMRAVVRADLAPVSFHA